MLLMSDLLAELKRPGALSPMSKMSAEDLLESIDVYSFSQPPENVVIAGQFGSNCKIVLRKELRATPGSIQIQCVPAPGRTRDNITVIMMGLPGSAHIKFSAGESVLYFGRRMGGFNCGVTVRGRSMLIVGEGSASGGTRIELSDSEVVIGKGCLFADSILLQSHDGHGVVDLETMSIVNKTQTGISIGDHVWIGRGATILKDVAIGHGSIVATQALVAKSCPPCTLVGGVPAKIIKSNVSWCLNRDMVTEQEKALLSMYKADLNRTPEDCDAGAQSERRIGDFAA